MVARFLHAVRGAVSLRLVRALSGCALVVGVLLSVARATDLDPTFDADARGFGIGFGVATQTDGKVIVGGLFSRADRGEVTNLARFNSDGTVDPTFNVGSSLNGTVRCVAVQSDGKVVIGGVFTAYGATARNSIARLNADGSLDTTFNPGTGFNGEVISLAIQSDGKIVAVGAFTSFNGTTRNRVARLTTAGAYDTTFAIGTGASDTVWDVALQANGQAILVGKFTTYNGTARNRIVRLTATGGVDTAFNPGTGANSDVVALALDSAGRPVIGGFFSTFNGVARECLARLTTAGALDTTFGTTAVFSSSYDTINDLKLDSAERILVAGNFYPAYQYNYNPAARGLARVNGDGNAVDESFLVPEAAWQFNRPGMSFRRILSLAVTPDDGVFAAGGMFDTVSGQAGILRVTNTGARDATFNGRAGLWFPPYINAVRPGAGGKYYVAGWFDWIGGARRVDLARFLPNAKIDASFAAYDGDYTDNQISEVLELPNGNVWAFGPFTAIGSQTRSGAALFSASGSLSYASPFLTVTGGNVIRALATASGDLALAGTFTQINATARAGVARVTAAGALDTTFVPGAGPVGGTIADAALDASGRLIVGGAFTSFSGTAEANLVRLSTAGVVDAAFAANTNVSAAVNSVQVQADGKILLGGIFANSGGYVFNGTTLLNTDGTPDLTFNPYPGANSYVYRARRAADGTVLVAGAFTTMQSQTRPFLARLTANGPVDTLFASDTVAGGYPSDLLDLPDGKILVRGTFTTIDGATRHGLARFHSTPVRRGALESAMNSAPLANGTVNAVVPLADGRFVVAGDFTTFSGASRTRVAAIDVYGQVDTAFAYTSGCNGAVLGGALDANGKILLWGNFTAYNGASAPGLVRINADGTVDTSFAPPIFNAAVNTVIVLPDGRLLVGGSFTFAGATPAGGLVRLQATGAVDATFNAGTGANGAVLAIARASDGSVFAGGAFTSFAGSAAPGVVKLTASGARASGFDLGAGSADSTKPVRALAVVSGDKLLVGGSFAAWAGANVGGLVRLNTDGSRDAAFLSGLGADNTVYAFAALADGRLYVGGAFTTLGGGERRGLLRLTASGVIDPVFDVGVGFSGGDVRALATVSDGRVVAGGTFTAYGGVARNRLAVLFASDEAAYSLPGDQIFTADVNPGDPFSLSYGAAISGLRYQWYRDGVRIPGATGATYAVAAAGLGDLGLYTLTFSNGAGEYTTQGWRVTVKLAPVISGAPLAQAVGYGASATFTVGAAGPGPFTYQWYRNGTAINGATGSSYTVANVGDADFGATFHVRITNAYGWTDSTPVALTFDTAAVPGALTMPFTGPFAWNGPAQAVVRTPGGQYYVGGSDFLTRLNADGTVDATFAPTLSQLNVTALALQSDGKLIVAGSMVTNSVTYGVVRLLSSGAVDPTFAPVTVVQSSASYATEIAALALQSDGKILLGGYFDTVAGTTRRYLARLNTNGSVDTTLAPTSDATGPNNMVNRIVVQGTNVIIAGAFTAYRGTTVNYLARFVGSTGANDTTFAGGTRADGAILGLVAQSDGKLIVHGNLTAYNGTARNKLARLNADGSLDTTFDPGSGPAMRAYYDTVSITAVAPSDNGTVIVLGNFDTFSGWPSPRSVRLTSTGAIDTQWASPSAANSNFNELFALSDGSLFVSGGISLSNGFYVNFARLLSGSYPPQAPAIATAPVAPGSEVAAGTRVELGALASGRGTLTFQWYRGTTALTNSTTVTGATSPVLTLRSIRASEAGAYKLRVTSSTNGFVETTPVNVAVAAERTGPGSLDLTWAADPLPRDSAVFGFAADGSAIVSFYDNYRSPERSYLRKFDANGVLLPASTFAPGTGFGGYVRELLVQSDGKVIATGLFEDAFGVTARNYLARVNANGTYDSAYVPAPDNQITDAVLQSDGKLIIIGYFANVTGTARAGVARLTTAGAVDTTFVPGAHGLTSLRLVRLATDTANLGKVYVVGYNSTTGLEEIVRLTTAGAIDTAFARPSFSSGSVADIVIDSSGRLVLTGSFTSISGQSRKTIARLTTAGALDTTFGITRSAGASTGPRALAIGTDGYIYLSLDSSGSSTFDGFPTGPLVRVDATAGQLDVNFPGSGGLRYDSLSETRLGWTGTKLVLTGFISGAPRTNYLRVNVDGAPTGAPTLLDSSGNRTVAEGTALTLFARFTGAGPLTYVWRKDGNVLAGATGPQLILTGTSAADAGAYTVTATNTSGSATATMNVTFFAADPLAPVAGITLASNFNGSVDALARGADGSVLATGSFTTVAGVTRRGLARFTAAGVLDTAFNNALPFSATNTVSVTATIIEPDGRILVLGNLGMSDGSTAYLVRLNANGSLAATLLNATNTTGGLPVAMARQSDGQIVVFGSFTTVASVARSKLARLSAAGVLDTTFAPTGIDTTEYNDLVIDSSGRLLLAGNFTRIGAATVATRLVRLTTAGALDATFTPPAFLNSASGIHFAADGRLFVYGQNGFVLGENSPLVQLTNSGQLDRSFSFAVNATVRGLAEDSSGRLYVLTTSQLLRVTRNGGIDRSVSVQSNPQALLGVGDRLLIAGGSSLTAIGGVNVLGLSYVNVGDADSLALLAPLPETLTVAQGGVLALRATFRGGDGAVAYQWFRNGNAISGATSPSLIVAGVTAADIGTYTLTATKGATTLTAGPTQVAVLANGARPGEVDLTWGAGLAVAGSLSRFYSDASNNLYLVGNVQFGTAAARPLVTLTPAGAARSDFTLSSRVTGMATGLRFLGGGKLLLYGSSLLVDGATRSLIRLNADGTLDTTFGTLTDSITDVMPLDDGRLLVIGSNGLVRYSAAGVLDATFTSGVYPSGSFHVAPAGKRWLVGSLYDAANNSHWLTRLNADGTPDATFVGPVLHSSESVGGSAAAPDGGLFVVLSWGDSNQSGFSSDYRRILHVLPDGTIDAAFAPGIFANSPSSASYSEMAVDAAGRLLVVGVFNSCDGVARNGIVRLLPSGVPDPSFANLPAATVTASTVPQRVVVQSSGRVLVSNNSGAALGGVTDRTGLFALVGTELPASTAPEITGALADRTLQPYDILSLAAPVLAPSGATFQWFKDGNAIAGATSSRYRLRGAPPSAAGDYTVRVTTSGGTVETSPVTVSIPPTDYSGALGALNAVTRVDTPALFGVLQPDGRVLVVSSGSSVNGSANYELFRLNADGTFAGGLPTVITGSNSSTVVSCAVVDPQGRIYLGGQFTTVNGVTRNRVARLLADGSLDPTWDPGVGPSSTVTSMALTSDGKLVIGGNFSQVAGIARQFFARLTATGALDPSFLVGTGLNNTPATLHVQADNRVIVGGAFTTYNGVTATRLIRVDTSGGLDATFAPAPSATVNFVRAASDGRLLIGGSFGQVAGVARTGLAWLSADGALLPATANYTSGYTNALLLPDGSIVATASNAIYRLRADGTPDTLFNNANSYRGAFYRGYSSNTPSSRLAPLVVNGNQLLVVGDIGRIGGSANSATANVRHAAVWLQFTDALTPVIGTAPVDAELPEGGSVTWSVGASTPAGTLTYAWTKVSDPTTVLSTAASFSRANLKPADAGQYRVVVANGEGYAEAFVNLVVRPATASRAGAIRLGFNTTVGTGALDVAPAANGRWWAITSSGLTRLLADGSADPAFAAVAAAGGGITGIYPLADGRFYVWGTFTTLGGQAVARLARFTADGQLDTTFNAALPAASTVSTLAPLSDGRLYVGGSFTVDLAGKATKNLVRLTAAGALDATFDPNGGLDNAPYVVRALADGRVLAAGPFTTAAGASRRGVVRFLATGALDTAFNNLNVANVYQLVVYPDGRLLIAGQFTTVDGVARAGVARLTAGGVVDPTFTLGATPNFNSSTLPIVLRPDGRIVIAGNFTESAGSRSRVLQFEADGALDPTFDGTRSFTGTVGGTSNTAFRDLVLLPTGHLIVVGTFTYLDDGVNRAGLVSLQGTPLAPEITADTIVNATLNAGGTISFSVTASGAPTLGYQWRRNSGAIAGATSATFTKANATAADAGTYDVVVTNTYGSATSRAAVVTLAPQAQTITFGALSDVPFGATPIALNASASSGLAVVFSVVSGPASVSGNQLTLLGTGAITVRAAQPGDGSYLAAATVDRTFNVTANFESWLVDNFSPTEIANPALSGSTADYDRDGVPNLVEYALGSNPKSASATGAPVLTLESGQWTLTYKRPASRPDVNYAVQFSTNLTTWSTSGITHGLVSTTNGVETWRATYPAATAPSCFLRLMVTR